MSGDNAVVARNAGRAPRSDLYAQTAAFSHYNNFAAQLPIDPESGTLVAGGAKEQAEQCFKNIKAIAESIGHSLNDAVRITVFVTDIKDMDAVDEVYRAFFPTYLPSRTVVAVAALPLGARVQIEALLSNGEGTIPNAPQAGDLVKYTNNTANAPIDALSTQIVAFSHYSNVSAQLPIDPVSGQIAVGGVQEQAAQCLKNIKAILASIDVPFDDIVKVNVFVKNLADIDEVDKAYARFFPDSGIARAVGYVPARTVVEVADLPLHALVQIEAVVSHGDGTPPQAVEDRHGLIIEANNADGAPKLPFATHSVAFSHYNNISAQLPIDPASGALVAGGVREQAARCFENVKAIIESVGHSMDDAVKVNLFMRNVEDLAVVDEVYRAFFPNGAPARRVVGVGTLPMDALIQVDAIFGNAEGTPPVA